MHSLLPPAANEGGGGKEVEGEEDVKGRKGARRRAQSCRQALRVCGTPPDVQLSPELLAPEMSYVDTRPVDGKRTVRVAEGLNAEVRRGGDDDDDEDGDGDGDELAPEEASMADDDKD